MRLLQKKLLNCLLDAGGVHVIAQYVGYTPERLLLKIIEGDISLHLCNEIFNYLKLDAVQVMASIQGANNVLQQGNNNVAVLGGGANVYKVLINERAELLVLNGKYIHANGEALHMLKARSPNDIVNKATGEMSPAYQPDGVLSFKKTADIFIKNKYATYINDWRFCDSENKTFDANVTVLNVAS